jgi:hypothetical protein
LRYRRSGVESRPMRTPRTATTGLLTRFAGLLDPDIRSPVRADGLWLVWPDGYVACSSSDTKVIAHYLDDVIRPHAVAV